MRGVDQVLGELLLTGDERDSLGPGPSASHHAMGGGQDQPGDGGDDQEQPREVIAAEEEQQGGQPAGAEEDGEHPAVAGTWDARPGHLCGEQREQDHRQRQVDHHRDRSCASLDRVPREDGPEDVEGRHNHGGAQRHEVGQTGSDQETSTHRTDARKRRAIQAGAAMARANSTRVRTPTPEAPLTCSPAVSLDRAGPAMSR